MLHLMGQQRLVDGHPVDPCELRAEEIIFHANRDRFPISE